MLNEEFVRDLERKGLKARYYGYQYDGTEYERRHTVEIIAPTLQDWAVYKHWSQVYEEAVDSMLNAVELAREAGIVVHDPCCSYDLVAPQTREEITYTETEDGWIDRCTELDIA